MNNIVLFFYDATDVDAFNGLAYLWEALSNRYSKWLQADMVNTDWMKLGPTDIYLINTVLPLETIVTLKHLGYNITFIGNAKALHLPFATASMMDVVVAINNIETSALIHAYYVYLMLAATGRRIDFLENKVVSDSLLHIYNNNFMELSCSNMVSGVYIAGINGQMYTPSNGNVVVYNNDLAARLKYLINCRGNINV